MSQIRVIVYTNNEFKTTRKQKTKCTEEKEKGHLTAKGQQ